MVRRTQHRLIAPHEDIIDAPRVDTEALNVWRHSDRFLDSGQDFRPQAYEIPSQRSEDGDRAIFEAMDFLKVHAFAGQLGEHDTTAFSSEIDGKVSHVWRGSSHA